jgi:hypothetical protein
MNHMTTKQVASKASASADTKPICGLIMPISAMPPLYDAAHWADVRSILDEAIVEAGMRPQMVSESFESDVIQQRIIANIFNNPVVVCDVSGLNPNVMFELGLRLSSKKATIIITDSVESLPFDTKIIEHIGYPRNLRILETREFISSLKDRIQHAYSRIDSGKYRPFLDNFTGVEAEEPKIQDVTEFQYIKSQLGSIQDQINKIRNNSSRSKGRALDLADFYTTGNQRSTYSSALDVPFREYRFNIDNNSQDEAYAIADHVKHFDGVLAVDVEVLSNRASYLHARLEDSKADEAASAIQEYLAKYFS